MDTLDGFFGPDDPHEEAPPPALVRPVDNPRLPADAGLTILGLLMEAAGGVLGLVALTLIFTALLPNGFGWLIAIVGLLSALRSAAQYRAGRMLVEQGPAGAGGVETYLLAAGVHTAICAVLLTVKLAPPGILVAFGAALSMAWPLLVVFISRRGGARAAIRAAKDADVRLVAEDRGLTALGILMMLGGVMALAVWTASALGALMGGLMKAGFMGLIGLALTALFGVRAFFGFQAGRIAARTRDPHRFHAAFERYGSFAFASVGLLGLLLLVVSLFAGAGGILGFAMMLPALLAWQVWPRAVRHYAERNLPEGTFSDERLPAVRRPRDAGLTGLGAVLLAIGLPGVITPLAALIVGQTELPDQFQGALADPVGLVTGPLALAAGWCLFNMTERFRAVAVLYGVVATGIGVWGGVTTIIELTDMAGFGGPQLALLAGVQVALALALPVTVLWLALRHEEVGEDAADIDLARAFE